MGLYKEMQALGAWIGQRMENRMENNMNMTYKLGSCGCQSKMTIPGPHFFKGWLPRITQ